MGLTPTASFANRENSKRKPGILKPSYPVNDGMEMSVRRMFRGSPWDTGEAASQLLVHQLEDLTSSLQSPQLQLGMAACTCRPALWHHGPVGPWGLRSASPASDAAREHVWELMELDAACPLLAFSRGRGPVFLHMWVPPTTHPQHTVYKESRFSELSVLASV